VFFILAKVLNKEMSLVISDEIVRASGLTEEEFLVEVVLL